MKSKTPLKAKTPLRAKAKPKKQPKPSVAKLKKKADAVHSQVVRLEAADKDGNVKCITCPNVKHYKQMQCGHFMSRQHNSTRYHFRNTAPQCYGCNVMHQGRQYEFGLELDKLYGRGAADAMHKLAKQSLQFTVDQLEKLIHDRTESLKFYENGVIWSS